MFVQDKIEDINARLDMLHTKKNIVVWGAGEHTRKMLERTDLLDYKVAIIVDNDHKKEGHRFFQYAVTHPEHVNWSLVDAVVISVINKENEITDMLRTVYSFMGEIVRLYNPDECMPFYFLPDRDREQIRYIDGYDRWEDAEKECKGYSDDTIINKVIESTYKVLKGEAVWERDSFLFYEPWYNYHICSVVLKCALQNKNSGVRLLDVGGALGSTYHQNKENLSDVENLEWIVAEQSKFAEYGKKNLNDRVLKFVDSTIDYRSLGKLDIILLSSSLQYIQEYEEIIKNIIQARPKYIILDRILIGDKKRICREDVPEYIYKGSYPVMIYQEDELLESFYPVYKLVEKDISSVPEKLYFIDGKAVGMYYVLRINS